MAATQPQQSAVKKTERQVAKHAGELQKFLEDHKAQIANALPRHITPERMIRLALTAYSRGSLLQKCDMRTIAGSIVMASIMGLECDGISGEAYLIPYYNSKAGGYECQLQPGYIGLVKLARNSGEFSIIDAQPVHEKDDFDFEKGSDVWWRHKWPKSGERGKILGYWAGYVLKDGGKNFEYWTKETIEAHRDHYSQGAYKKDRGVFVKDAQGNKILQGPWADSPDWMFRKTPLKQVLKLAPKSYEMRVMMALDDRSEAEVRQPFTIDVPLELQPPMEDNNDESVIPEPIKEPQQKTEPKAEEKKDPPVDKVRLEWTDRFAKMEANLGTAEFMRRLGAGPDSYGSLDEILTTKMPSEFARMEKA